MGYHVMESNSTRMRKPRSLFGWVARRIFEREILLEVPPNALLLEVGNPRV